MLVFGDADETADTAASLERVRVALHAASAAPPGVQRHAALVSAFVAMSALAQGIADSEFVQQRMDAPSAAQAAATAVLMACAAAIRVSWLSGFAQQQDSPRIGEALRRLVAAPKPDRVRLKRAEAFAFYALYPEAYLAAAAKLGRKPWLRAIGIRGVGMSLAAVVADAVEAPTPISVSLWDRRLALAPDLTAQLAAARAGEFAVVDQGPASSDAFGCVADLLAELGVAPERIHFFPGHVFANGHVGESAPQADPTQAARWAKARCHVVSLDELVVRTGTRAHRLESWAAELVGPAEAPLEDISAGAWRHDLQIELSQWPPAHVQQERRKFLMLAHGATWLLKFIGLGALGEKKAARAQILADSGFTPHVAGYRHGFLVERWHGEARTLDPARTNRGALISHVGRYLAFRAKRFPADSGTGASLAALLTMARQNAVGALGASAAALFERWAHDIGRLDSGLRRIETDNRLHAWEWLSLPDGRLIKADAVDHHAGHDLVGCQDVAWDVAGAAVELGLSPVEVSQLCTVIATESGRPVSPPLLQLLLPCYLAFQLGYYVTAATALAANPDESGRMRGAAQRYAGRLEAMRRAAAG